MAEYDYSEQGAGEGQDGSERRLRKEVTRALRNAQIEQQKKGLMRQLMDDRAYERLMNIRASNRDLYSKLVDMIISLARAQRLQGKMTEQQFLSIMGQLTARPESHIDFKRK